MREVCVYWPPFEVIKQVSQGLENHMWQSWVEKEHYSVCKLLRKMRTKLGQFFGVSDKVVHGLQSYPEQQGAS